MSAKRALVVDDSKSARAFLSRLLEKHHLDVDTAESAEDAIEYLNRHRPDVIFMDHLMPGMDGFQAVQAIKNNPVTATIPILMYTSQEGELYLGQARALGAVGVLPKQIRPVDVTTVLQQLHLAGNGIDIATTGSFEAEPALATAAASGFASETQPVAPDLPAVPVAAPLPPLVDYAELGALREEIGELRRQLLSGLEAQAERLRADLPQLLRDAQPAPPEPVGSSRDWRGALYAVAATAAAIVLAALWLRGEVERRSLQMQVAQLSQQREAPQAEPAVAAPAEALAVQAGATPLPLTEAQARPLPAAPVAPGVFAVPYGELPLAGARVERLRTLLNQLADSGFQGVVEVQAFPGRFCLAGNDIDGFSLAADALPVTQCERLGNPADEALGAAQRESLPFANMVAEFRKARGETIDLRLLSGSADQVLRPYPDAGGTGRIVSAGEWNAAAGANSRVEVHWRPRS